MNPEDYVSYPIALALKKAGFDLAVNYYDNEGYIIENLADYSEEVPYGEYTAYDNFNYEDFCSAPTLAQAQKWLRDIKRLSIEPYANIAVAWNYNIADLDNFAENVGGEASFPSYESALSAGIAAALELIEKKGE